MPGIQNDIQLSPFTTFGLGGRAEYFARAQTVEELTLLFEYAEKENLSVTLLGGGSNVLIADSGLSGLVIKNEIKGKEMVREDEESAEVFFGGGEAWDACVAFAVQYNLWGIENLSHIPGTAGAAPVQNIGAYGTEVKDVIKKVHVYDTQTKKVLVLKNNECAFAYRSSFFKKDATKQFIVLGITVTLSKISAPNLSYRQLSDALEEKKEYPTLQNIRETIIEIRSEKFPYDGSVGCAGSFFMNPVMSTEDYHRLQQKYPEIPSYIHDKDSVKIPLGWILDHVLCVRGVRIGNVGTYEGQALVVVAYKGATSTEVDSFAQTLEQKIFDATGITVMREVTSLK